VSELNISWDEFIYWQEFLKMEPPDQAENARTAAIMAQLTNMAGKSLPAGKTVTAEDFLGRREQTAEEQIAFLKALSNG